MAKERDKITNLRPLSGKSLAEVKATFLPRDGAERSFKTQGLASLMPKITRKVAGKRPTLVSDLQAAWPEVVGAQMAALTRPVSLKAKVLVVEAAQGAGPMIAMGQEKMLKAVRLHLAGDTGSERVARISLRQTEKI